MPPTYSGGHVDDDSRKSISRSIQRTVEWMAEHKSRSSASSTSRSPSPSCSRKSGDLDLDSLFKRLDKYTAEMEEVEARLKRARSTSKGSVRVNIKQFSFAEDHDLEERETLPPVSHSSRISMRSHTPAETHRSRDSPALEQKQTGDLSEISSEIISDVETAASRKPEAMSTDSGARDLINWIGWAEEQFSLIEPTAGRSSSRYSDRPELYRESAQQKFVWQKQPPSPPSNKSWRTSHAEQRQSSSEASRDQSDGGVEYNEYDFTEEDEPGPSAPTFWTLPPRTSSKMMPIEEKMDNRNDPRAQPPRRRMNTTEGRPSIRNGGFWSHQAASLFPQDNIPSVPALSQSSSSATLKSSPPPTPLALCSPREDQIRREMESFALQDGPETLELRYKKRRPPMLNLLDSDDERDDSRSVSTEQEQDHSSLLDLTDDHSGVSAARPRVRRQKSIFSIFQRRSPVEKLIDMYFDEEEENSVPKRRSTWARKGSPTQAKVPNSSAVPPLPQALHHEKQTSF